MQVHTSITALFSAAVNSQAYSDTAIILLALPKGGGGNVSIIYHFFNNDNNNNKFILLQQMQFTVSKMETECQTAIVRYFDRYMSPVNNTDTCRLSTTLICVACQQH